MQEMFLAAKKFKFEGAHVLKSSYSEECQNIHGHSYEVEVTFSSEKLNEDGMVVDFKLVKDVIGPIFDDLDHALLFHSDSYAELIQKCPGILSFGWKMRILGSGINPTAENMAKVFHIRINNIIASLPSFAGVTIHCIDVRETKTGCATYWRAL